MTDRPFRKYYCLMCDLVFDEEFGMPEDGIAPGTRFEDIPDGWSCPDCSASKSDFCLIE